MSPLCVFLYMEDVILSTLVFWWVNYLLWLHMYDVILLCILFWCQIHSSDESSVCVASCGKHDVVASFWCTNPSWSWLQYIILILSYQNFLVLIMIIFKVSFWCSHSHSPQLDHCHRHSGTSLMLIGPLQHKQSSKHYSCINLRGQSDIFILIINFFRKDVYISLRFL